MSQTECPKCHALQARRVRQQGMLQTLILCHLGFYPWECRFCKATFVLRKRGHRTKDNVTVMQPPRAHNTHHEVAGD